MAEALTKPSALLLAGAGASAAILGGLPLAAAAGVGALAYAARIALAVPRRKRGERVQPSSLREPWRSFVLDAQTGQRRFHTTVDRASEGPLQERLVDLGRRIDEAVGECWRIARRGEALDTALGELDVQRMYRELQHVEAEQRRQPPGSTTSSSLDRTRASLQAQLESARRIGQVAAEARDRLRLLNAQLDEAVARAVELSLRSADAGELRPLTDDVDSLVGELEALRAAMEETR